LSASAKGGANAEYKIEKNILHLGVD